MEYTLCEYLCFGRMLMVGIISFRRLFRTPSALCVSCPPPNYFHVLWITWPSDCPIQRWGWWRGRNTQSCKRRRVKCMIRASSWGKASPQPLCYNMWHLTIINTIENVLLVRSERSLLVLTAHSRRAQRKAPWSERIRLILSKSRS